MRAKPEKRQKPWSNRPRFAPRQLLTADQLNKGLDDELNRQRLLNRAIHGHGVVFGYAVSETKDRKLEVTDDCIEISCGLALDRHGRMLYWPEGSIGMADIVGRPPDCEGLHILSVHYAERLTPPDGCLPCSGESPQWREQGVVFTLRLGCQVVDRPCPDHPQGTCIRHDQYLGHRTGAVPEPDDEEETPSRTEARIVGDLDAIPGMTIGDEGLIEHSKLPMLDEQEYWWQAPGRLPPSPDLAWACKAPGPLCRTDCGTWQYDPEPAASIPIACLRIRNLTPGSTHHSTQKEHSRSEQTAEQTPDRECEPTYGFDPQYGVETTAVRPYVYRNPLLYELLNCCDVDLPRVSEVSWADWLEGGWVGDVDWELFESRMQPTSDGFTISFSKPIRISTLHPGSVYMTAVFQEERTDYWMAQRVPMWIDHLDPIARQYCTQIRLVPDSEWVSAEISSRRSTLFGGARIEVVVRGQLLRDQCGQMLDARPLDMDGSARCQSRPGGDFISTFQVKAMSSAGATGQTSDKE